MRPMRSMTQGSAGGAAVMRTIAAAAVFSLVVTRAPAQDSVDPRNALQNQVAENQALAARIEKLEEMLKRDVCADPAAAQALLNEPVAPQPKGAPRSPGETTRPE